MASNIERVSMSRHHLSWGYTDLHYNDVIMGAIASQITSLTIVYSMVYSDADQRKHHSSASLAFVWGIHWGEPVNSPHKWPVMRKMFPFDDVIMRCPRSPSTNRGQDKIDRLVQERHNSSTLAMELRPSWIKPIEMSPFVHITFWKLLYFWFKFHWNLFPRVQMTINHCCFT